MGRIVRPSARTFIVTPDALGKLGITPEPHRDRFSPAWLVGLASRAIRDVAVLCGDGEKAGKRISTLALEVEVPFASADARWFAPVAGVENQRRRKDVRGPPKMENALWIEMWEMGRHFRTAYNRREGAPPSVADSSKAAAEGLRSRWPALVDRTFWQARGGLVGQMILLFRRLPSACKLTPPNRSARCLLHLDRCPEPVHQL
jgi:hypothetical protein